MMPLPNLLAAVFLGTGNSYSKIIPRAFFYNSLLDVTEVQSKSIRVLSRYFGMKLLRLEIQLKTGKSGCSAVICRKRSPFDMQFHLIVVSIGFNYLLICLSRPKCQQNCQKELRETYKSKPSLLKYCNYYEVKLHFKSTSVSTNNS